MVRVITAKTHIPSEHLLGQFLDESHYDILIDEDCDVYKPPMCDVVTTADCQPQTDCSTCARGVTEDRVAFKLRKNFFSKKEQQEAYEGLRGAATATNNRGIAAGIQRVGKNGNRDWVTQFEQAAIKYFQKPYTVFEGMVHPIDELIARKAELSEPGDWNTVWFTSKKIDIMPWIEETRKLDAEAQKKAAKYLIDEHISSTTYANEVLSGIAGAFGRVPRVPYGRLSAYNEKHPEQFERSIPFLRTLDNAFSELLPQRHAAQKEFVQTFDPHFRISDTVFTTLTVNKTFRTAAHLDAGDYGPGFSNLLVLSNDGNYTGGYLVCPEYRIAVNVRPGDLLLIANHTAIHGNTPIVLGSEQSERISVVAYAREDLKGLGSWEYETTRRAFVEDRANNPEHPDWWERWNGVSPGMWQSEEWYNYLNSKMSREEAEKYDPAIFEKFNATDLQEFFG